jgi:hypothetical protein
MGVQVTLKDIQSGFLSATTHTANNTLIEEALDKALDRTSNVNNAMAVDLDMGLNYINNVREATSDFQATNKRQVEDLVISKSLFIGFAPPLPYAAGIAFTTADNSKTVEVSGNVYAPLTSALPFSTSGIFVGDDDARFYVVQGLTVDKLPDYTNINFTTVEELKADVTVKVGDFITIESYTATNNSGALFGSIVPGGTGTEDGLNYINLTASGLQFKQTVSGPISVRKGGLEGDGVVDDTTAWNLIEPSLVDGDKIVFPKGTYKGNFSTKKAVSFEFDKGAKLINSTDVDPVLKIGPDFADFTSYPVTETTLVYLDTLFTVVGASGLFSVGDIGYLYDGSVRPTGGNVNQEMVKIKSITGDQILVEGIIHAHKGTSSITFSHSAYQPKNVSVTGIDIEPTSSHNAQGFLALGVEDLVIADTTAKNTTGEAISVRNCYNISVENTTVHKPNAVGSGQGYGVALFNVTIANVQNVVGHGTRHILDADSVYGFDYKNIEETNDQSAPVAIAHNGFAGFGTINNVRVKTAQYPVSTSDQGFGPGASNAKKKNHPLRNVTIKNVFSTVDVAVAPDAPGTRGVYLRNNLDNVHVDNVNVNHINGTALSAAATSILVRVDGIAIGPFTCKNISADRIGRGFFSNGDSDSAVIGDSVTKFEGVSCGDIRQVIFAQGSWKISVDDISVGDVLGTELIHLETTGSDDPKHLNVGNKIKYTGTLKQVYKTTVLVTGNVVQSSRDIASSIVVSAAFVITAAHIQNRGNFLRLVAPVGAGTVTMGDFPTPYVDGQTITVTGWNIGRQDILIPSTIPTIAADITFDASTPAHTLIAYGGLWRKTR